MMDRIYVSISMTLTKLQLLIVNDKNRFWFHEKSESGCCRAIICFQNVLPKNAFFEKTITKINLFAL